MNKVYLAGGLRSNWQQKVIDSVKATFFNPRQKEVDQPMTLQEYGTWDLHHVKKADLVFAYMEKDNPSGIGLSVEIGYAKGLGKTVVLCLEPNNEHKKDSYLSFLKKAADIVFEDFDKAVEYLKNY